MIEAVSPATGLVPVASRPVKNVCNRTLVGPHSASYQLWYAIGVGFAGGGPLSCDDGLEASSPAASRRSLEHLFVMEPNGLGKNGGGGSDCAEVGADACCRFSWWDLVFEWGAEEDVRDPAAPRLPFVINGTHSIGGRCFGRKSGA